MSCNCKVKKDIHYIQSRYGTGNGKDKQRRGYNLSIGGILSGIFIVLLQIILIPVFTLRIIHGGIIRKKPITIPAFLNVRK